MDLFQDGTILAISNGKRFFEEFDNMKTSLSAIATALLMAMSGGAYAAACTTAGAITGADLGTMSTADATLSLNGGAATASDACNLSSEGNGGNTSGTLLGTYYSPTYGTGNFTQVLQGATINGVTFTSISFVANVAQDTGTWTFNWTGGPASLDLAVGIHASNRAGTFLFNDRGLVANSSGSGAWEINWLNNGGNVPDFSNFSFWARPGGGDVPGPGPLPEPAMLGLLGLGLAGIVAARRRRAA